MSAIKIKRGDSLVLNIELKDADDAPLELDVADIRSQVRKPNGELIGTLTVETTATPGTYRLSSDDTQNWPVRTLECDIEMVIAGTVVSSETFAIDVIRDVTA